MEAPEGPEVRGRSEVQREEGGKASGMAIDEGSEGSSSGFYQGTEKTVTQEDGRVWEVDVFHEPSFMKNNHSLQQKTLN